MDRADSSSGEVMAVTRARETTGVAVWYLDGRLWYLYGRIIVPFILAPPTFRL